MHRIGILLFSAFLITLAGSSSLEAQRLYINELMSKNDNTLPDEDGDFTDWIELYNAEDTAINLEGFALSDERDERDKWRFPAVQIASKSYLVIFASGKNKLGSELHTSFKIKSEGEWIILSNANLKGLDSVGEISLLSNESYGRKEDGSNLWVKFDIASPGLSNNAQTGQYHLNINPPSHAYSNPLNITINSIPDIRVHYTLNGNIPKSTDPEFTGSLNLPVGLIWESKIELIPSTPLQGPDRLKNLIWKTPVGATSKANVLRFRAFKDNTPVSSVYTRIYIPVSAGAKAHFDYAFITTDSLNLFHSDSGIYLPGKHFDTLGYTTWLPEGNYNAKGKQYEKKAHFAYFTPKGKLKINENVGIRIHGNSSTAKAQKAFKVFFRDEYGKDELDFNFFDLDTAYRHERFILRNGGSDLSYVHFRDALLQNLMKDLGLETQNSRPTLLYLNGVYWGVYNLRDDLNHDFLHQKYGHDKDSINIAWNCGGHNHNDYTRYRNFIGWLSSVDLSNPNTYKTINETLDVEQFVNYYLGQIYFGNFDWPGNNFLIWYTKGNLKPLVFDLDFTFGRPVYGHDKAHEFNTLIHATSEVQQHWSNAGCATTLLRHLLKNDSFKNQFIQSFQYSMANDFSFEKVNKRIDSFKKLYEPAMQQHIDRWGHPQSISAWHHEIDQMRLYALQRPCALKEHFSSYFGEDIPIQCDKLPESENKWVAYPNPTQTGSIQFYRKSDRATSGTFHLFDAQGKKRKTGSVNLNFQNKFQFSLPTQGLSSGVYIMQFVTEKDQETIRIVIL